MQNFTLFSQPSVSWNLASLACIIVIVPNVANIFTAQTQWIPGSGSGGSQTVHNLKEVKLSQVFRVSWSKVVPYKLREYV